MIRRYNQIQKYLLPVHLLGALVGVFLTWLFFKIMVYRFRTGWTPRPYENEIILALTAIALIGGFIAAFRMWSRDETSLPGVLSAVPSFGRRDFRASYGEYLVTEYSFYGRLLGNLFLFGPLQTLYAFQRRRNLIPESQELEARVSKWLNFSKGQKRWHSPDLYAEDYDALDYLIQMGKIDFSPTKYVVKVRRD